MAPGRTLSGLKAGADRHLGASKIGNAPENEHQILRLATTLRARIGKSVYMTNNDKFIQLAQLINRRDPVIVPRDWIRNQAMKSRADKFEGLASSGTLQTAQSRGSDDWKLKAGIASGAFSALCRLIVRRDTVVVSPGWTPRGVSEKRRD